MSELDPVRQLILERVPNLKEMSLAIGKSHSYLQQFLKRGIPVELPERVRKRLAEKLNVSEDLLRGGSAAVLIAPRKTRARKTEQMPSSKSPLVREVTDRDNEIAKRLRILREAEGEDSSSAWAERMGFSAQQYSNYENGYPLPRDPAMVLAREIPGLTIDWLFIGREEGLSFDIRRRLRAAAKIST
jgi:transcriptional regulator with XRE-family HTH domain